MEGERNYSGYEREEAEVGGKISERKEREREGRAHKGRRGGKR